MALFNFLFTIYTAVNKQLMMSVKLSQMVYRELLIIHSGKIMLPSSNCPRLLNYKGRYIYYGSDLVLNGLICYLTLYIFF